MSDMMPWSCNLLLNQNHLTANIMVWINSKELISIDQTILYNVYNDSKLFRYGLDSC